MVTSFSLTSFLKIQTSIYHGNGHAYHTIDRHLPSMCGFEREGNDSISCVWELKGQIGPGDLRGVWMLCTGPPKVRSGFQKWMPGQRSSSLELTPMHR